MSRAVLLFAALAVACSGAISAPGIEEIEQGPSGTSPGKTPLAFMLSAANTELYLAKLAPPIVGRVLTKEERERITREQGSAIRPIVTAWIKETGFVQAARNMIEIKLSVSGTRDGIDFGLPGNLAAYLAREDQPWSKILTDDKCRDKDGGEIACDSGAPFTAGVLTTRAYLVSRASRFNLTRSSAMLKTFACRVYPQEDTLQPRIPKEKLIPMFRALTLEEQTDERAKSGFGNGSGCYTCHGQFSAHAQLFVKFDQLGKWQKDATGLQDETGELGRSKNGLMASHFVDPIAAGSEQSQVFGKEVKNLAEAAKVITESAVFLECASRNIVEYSLGLTKPPELEPDLLASLAQRARTFGGADPSLGAIAIATLTHEDIQKAVVKMLTGTTPESAAVEATP
jgi:hypothetical protein